MPIFVYTWHSNVEPQILRKIYMKAHKLINIQNIAVSWKNANYPILLFSKSFQMLPGFFFFFLLLSSVFNCYFSNKTSLVKRRIHDKVCGGEI